MRGYVFINNPNHNQIIIQLPFGKMTALACPQSQKDSALLSGIFSSSPSRIRTYDLAVNSRPLYLLSYRGINAQLSFFDKNNIIHYLILNNFVNHHLFFNDAIAALLIIHNIQAIASKLL